jgi:hypothetical protein
LRLVSLGVLDLVLLIISLTLRIAARCAVGLIGIDLRRWRATVGLAPIALRTKTLQRIDLLFGRRRARGVVAIPCGTLRRQSRARIGRRRRRGARTQWLRVPVRELVGRRCWRTARGVPPKFSKWISLSDKSRKFRKRIVARRFGWTARRWFTCAESSLELVFRHSVPGY